MVENIEIDIYYSTVFSINYCYESCVIGVLVRQTDPQLHGGLGLMAYIVSQA